MNESEIMAKMKRLQTKAEQLKQLCKDLTKDLEEANMICDTLLKEREKNNKGCPKEVYDSCMASFKTCEIEFNKEKRKEAREHLAVITNGLREMARCAGRTDCDDNQLLRECYNLVDVLLGSSNAWSTAGYYRKHSSHPYLFWTSESLSKAVEERTEEDLKFLYCKDQLQKEFQFELDDLLASYIGQEKKS